MERNTTIAAPTTLYTVDAHSQNGLKLPGVPEQGIQADYMLQPRGSMLVALFSTQLQTTY